MIKFVEYFQRKLIVSVAAKGVQVLIIIISMSVSDLEVKNFYSIIFSPSFYHLPLQSPAKSEFSWE